MTHPFSTVINTLGNFQLIKFKYPKKLIRKFLRCFQALIRSPDSVLKKVTHQSVFGILTLCKKIFRKFSTPKFNSFCLKKASLLGV